MSQCEIKIAPHSWVACVRPVFVLNETDAGGNALISGRDIDETTKDACERAGVEMKYGRGQLKRSYLAKPAPLLLSPAMSGNSSHERFLFSVTLWFISSHVSCVC
jgi:hypothetical protein